MNGSLALQAAEASFVDLNALTPLISWPHLGDISQNLPPASSPWLGIIMVRWDLTVAGANRTAISMAAENDGIAFRDGRVHLDDRQCAARLQKEAAAAISTPRRAAFPLPRPSGRRPYCALVATASHAPANGAPGLAAIVLADTLRRVRLPTDAARDVFGLSSAEIELANCLANGDDLRAAAASIGISYNTARSQLASMFRKTETSRQAELVKVLLTGLVAF